MAQPCTGSAKMRQEIRLADIKNERILGLDILQPDVCQVSLRVGALVIGEEESPLSSASELPCSKVVLVGGVPAPTF